MTVDEVLEKLEGVQRRGSSYIALCPAHEDRSPSLSVAEGDDGTPLLKCHAGCTFEQIAKAIGMNGKKDKWDAKNAEATYDYVDEQGQLLFQVLRMPGKEFPARHRNEHGWQWGLKDVRRVPYNLPGLIQALKDGKWIVIVEGEKDADAGNANAGSDYFFTCNPGGAGKWLAEYTKFFVGAKVILWADKDDPGLAHARKVRRMLAPVVEEFHVVQSLAGKDAYDHLIEAQLTMQHVDPLELSEEDEIRLSDVDLVEVAWHWKPYVQVGTFHLLAGDGKVGKGVWLAGLAAAITRGLTDATDEPQNVLVVASEDSASIDLKPRIIAAGGDPSRVVILQRHLLLPRDIGYLEEKIGQERAGAGTGLVFIDPVANHIGNASSDDETSVRAAINELNYVAERTNCTIIGVRHLNKSGGVLGSGAWVNSPRIVLMFELLDQSSPARTLRVHRSNRGASGSKLYYKLTEAQIPGHAEAVPLLVSDSYTAEMPVPDITEEAIRNDPWFIQA